MNPTIEGECNAQVTRFSCHALCGINKKCKEEQSSSKICWSFMYDIITQRGRIKRHKTMVKYQEGEGDTLQWSKECQK